MMDKTHTPKPHKGSKTPRRRKTPLAVPQLKGHRELVNDPFNLEP